MSIHVVSGNTVHFFLERSAVLIEPAAIMYIVRGLLRKFITYFLVARINFGSSDCVGKLRKKNIEKPCSSHFNSFFITNEC